mgnify:CR=1 FL=1
MLTWAQINWPVVAERLGVTLLLALALGLLWAAIRHHRRQRHRPSVGLELVADVDRTAVIPRVGGRHRRRHRTGCRCPQHGVSRVPVRTTVLYRSSQNGGGRR